MLLLSSDQLSLIQGTAALFFLLCLGGGTIYLLAGLVRPAWVRRHKRRWVAATTFGVWVLGFATYLGALAFTHSHPNGPHAFQGYWDHYIKELCAEGQDLPACREQPPRAPAADPGPKP